MTPGRHPPTAPPTIRRPRLARALSVASALAGLLVAAAAPAFAHPGHAAHAPATDPLAPTAVGAGVALLVAAAYLRSEDVVTGRTAAVGAAVGLATACAGAGAAVGVGPA